MNADRPRVSKHDHFARYVTDLERSTKWYQEILGLEPVYVEQWWDESSHFLANDDAQVALFLKGEDDAYSSRDMPIGNHNAFRMSRADYDRYKRFLSERGITYHESDHGLSRSVYFRDPDDYWVELTTYDVSS